jgi:hypothetical protein
MRPSVTVSTQDLNDFVSRCRETPQEETEHCPQSGENRLGNPWMSATVASLVFS